MTSKSTLHDVFVLVIKEWLTLSVVCVSSIHVSIVRYRLLLLDWLYG